MIQNKLTSEIPSGWSIFSLEDVAEIVSGVTKGRKLVGRATTWMPYLRVANVQAGYLNLEEIKEIEVPVEEVDKYRLQPGDVVMTEGGDPDKLGRGTVWNGEIDLCLHQNHIFRVRPNVEMLDSHYLKAYLGSKSAQKYFLRCAKQTTGIASINKTQLRAFPVPLPTLEEQRRIATILDKADAVRRKRQEAIALTEELLRSAFLEMFGDPVTNPKGWETACLGKLLAEPLQNGAYFPKEYYVEDGTGTEMVHMSDAFYGVVKRGNLKRVTITPADIQKYGLNSNDVLVARRSLNYEGSAKPCLIPAAQESLIFESSLIRVRLNRDILDPIFFFSYMLQPCARETYVFPHVTRSTISGINQAGLQRVQVLVPPISLQKHYRRLYETVNSFGSSYERNIGLLDNLFNSLLQRAFRGEL